jgi:hypothetical protein
MIPDHVVTLVIAVFVAWFILRWGATICLTAALVCFWDGEFLKAALAAGAAFYLHLTKALALWMRRDAEDDRAPWL